MAKALLLNALHDALSDYVVGLSPEKLKVGVWSGKIVLNELEVNPEAVNQLHLPVNIIHGKVKKLEVDIPWAHLGSRPVKVIVEGVCLLVGPVDKNSWGADDVRKRRLGIKRDSLDKADAKSKSGKDTGDDDKKKGFVEKLVQRIVDNIEIKVADIHIRYEDTILVPGQTVSAGLCLKSFVVATTDENYEPQFVDRTKSSTLHVKVHKLARVNGFSVYWRVDDTERFEAVAPGERNSAMRKFVAEQAVLPEGDKNGGGLDRGYIIRPTNSLLKFIHNDDQNDEIGPMFEASFEMDDVNLDVRAEQYEQVLSLKDATAALANWQTFFPYRPKTTPLEDPKAWWRYAFVCVTGKPDGWAKINKVLKSRKEYSTLYEKLEEAGATSATPPSKRNKSPLNEDEQRRLDVLEEELPLHSILMFRTMTRHKLKRDREEEKKAKIAAGGEDSDNTAAAGGGGSWWGKIWGGGDKSSDDDDDVGLSELTDDFTNSDDTNKKPAGYRQMRVSVHPQGSMRLYGPRELPLVEARMAASATAEMREDSSMSVSFSLARLDILDLFTDRPVFPHMLRVRGRDHTDDTPELEEARKTVAEAVKRGGAAGYIKTKAPGAQDEDPLVCVNVALGKTALMVEVCALPTDVAYNREAVDAVMSVFSARPAETEAAMSGATKSIEAAQQKSKELTSIAISLSIDVAAPKITVPMSSCHDRGFLLVDMGHVLVKGGTKDDGAMVYTAVLKDMSVRLPKRKALLIKGTGDALVEPFQIKAHASMGGGPSKPGTAVTVEVLPGVVGVVSPAKIKTLFGVLDYVTKADLNTDDGPGEPPIGLAAPNNASEGGGSGVAVMGGDLLSTGDGGGGLAYLEGDSSEDEAERAKKEEAGKDEEPQILMEVHLKLAKVSLLLIESAEDVKDKDSGFLFEAAGMSMDLETSSKDMTAMVHLDALKLEDRSRPDDSPFRHMIHSTADETSHGGLIHVTYWAALGGVRRVPPDSIHDVDQEEYDMVVDARFSTLQLAIDKECVVTSTPFFKAVTRQDDRDAEEDTGERRLSSKRNSRGRSKSKSGAGDTRSVTSRSTRVAGAAKRAAAAQQGGSGKRMLAKASLTSVAFELVRSDPWEPVMRAGVAGLAASFKASGEDGGMEASVTLTDIELTDVRPDAKDNAYRMILAPLEKIPQANSLRDRDDDDKIISERVGAGSSGAGYGDGEERAPLIAVTAKMAGKSSLEAEVKLASFACNLMVEPIKKSLAVMMDVNAAVATMVASGEKDDAGEGQGGGQHGGGDTGRLVADSSGLDALEEGDEGVDVDSASGERGTPREHAAPEKASVAYSGAGAPKAGPEGKEAGGGSSPSTMCARLALDDWRINLIEEPAKASSKVVVLRASVVTLFTRSVTQGEGGDSTEDTLHLSLLKMESLVDKPPIQGPSGGGKRRISQMLEPFAAEVHTTLLSARGSLVSVDVNLVAEAVDARLSYRDMMLLKGIADEATAPDPELEPDEADAEQETETVDPEGGETEKGGGLSLLPETYEDADKPAGETEDAAVNKAAAARAGIQPSTITAMSVSAVCSLARVVLINDYEGQGLPVLSLSSEELKAKGSGFEQDFSIELSGAMQASCFNVRVVRWEPLCEPWRPVLTASLGQDFKGTRIVRVNLACEEVVVFDLTSDFMESFLSTYWMLFNDGGGKDDPFVQGMLSEGEAGNVEDGSGDGESGSGDASETSSSSKPDDQEESEWAEGAVPLDGLKEGNVVLKNGSGMRLIVGTSDSPKETMKLGPRDTVPLPFETQRHRARTGEFDLRGKAALVMWGDEDVMGAREALPPLQVDRTGVYVFPMLPTDPIPEGYVVSAPVVVEACQSQRFHMLTRKWKAPFMPGDGPEFTTKDWLHGADSETEERPLDSIRLPDEEKWEWRDEWHVDFSKEVGTQIDAAGWEYGIEFGAFNLVASSRTRRDLDQARRRKWIRTRVPKALPIDDPFRPLHVAWEVAPTPQGRLEANIRSTAQVKNDTDLHLELKALCSAWAATKSDTFEQGSFPSSMSGARMGSRSLGSVAPGCTMDIPVKMVYASHLQVRPVWSPAVSSSSSELGDGGSFEWGAPIPLLANSVDVARDEWVSCREVLGEGGSRDGKEGTTMRLVVHAETTPEGCVLMTVLPPVTVVNSLPCPLSFHALLPSPPDKEGAASRRSSGKVLEAGRVPTAETAYLHTVEVGDGVSFAMKIAHHGWSTAERLLPATREELRAGRWVNKDVVFKLPCNGGDRGYLEVRCHFEARVGKSCPALRLKLFCSHWLVDRSGLQLGFGVSKKRRLPAPVIQSPDKREKDEEAKLGQMHQAHVVPVHQLSCVSKKGAVVTTATVGGLLYTDREYKFTKHTLPQQMCGATMIRTACSDKNDSSQHFLRFRVEEASTVHVLFDRRCASPPDWLTSAFRLTDTRVRVDNKLSKGRVADCPFAVWSRSVSAGSWVNLGGNKASQAKTMYSVMVTEEDVTVPINAAAASRVKRKITTRDDLDDSWAIGTEGLALCNSPDEQIRVAVPDGAGRRERPGSGGDSDRGYGNDGLGNYTHDSWSDEIDVPAGTNGVFQVDGAQGEIYELALHAETCPGTFRRTTQVTVVPRYCVVNLLSDEDIWLKEPDAPDSSAVSVPPGGRMPWHWLRGKASRDGIKIRTEGTAWSYGDVKISQVGTTALHIPFFGEDEDLDGQDRGQAGGPPMKLPEPSEGSGGGGGAAKKKPSGLTRLDKLKDEQTVVHVDVKLADNPAKDEYAVLVVFWKADDVRFSPIYSARNSSSVDVCLHQEGSGRDQRETLKAKAAWRLKPGDTRQVGWAYPSENRSLLITAGKGSHAARLNTDTIGNYAKIQTGTGGGAKAVWASVIVEGGTKFIKISGRAPRGSGGKGGQQKKEGEDDKQANVEKETAVKRKQESETAGLELSVNMRGFGMSVVTPIDGRRTEMIYAQVSDIRAKLSRDRLSSLELSVGALQVDNHLPDGLYPVLVCKREDEEASGDEKEKKEAKGTPAQKTPFLQVTIIKEVNASTNTAHYDYVAFRMLEMDIMADRATLLHMLVLYKPVQGYLLMWRQQLDSRSWVAKRTAEVLERGASDMPGGFVDVAEVRRTARIKRKYFKTMRFHPLMLRLSYAKTPISNQLMDEAGMPIINKIPSMVKSQVDLASYLVEDAFGSIKDISKNVQSHYTVQGSMQVLNLVGSMRALGSPADLVSNVGGGAKSLVYKPALGLVQGPAEFFEGVNSGAQSFVKGTVHGVFNSVAGVGGAVNDTVSKLTFDDQYRLKREKQKNKAMAEQGGIGKGFAQGGRDIAGGLSSGVSGIFTNPVNEAKKGGFGGFVKGMGKGLVGAVVKPVVGVSDSVVSVAQGISNEADAAQRHEHLRVRRALTKDADSGHLVLTAFSSDAAEAQALVESGAGGKGQESNDKYECFTKIGDLTIIFADTRVIIVKGMESGQLGKAERISRPGKAQPRQMVSKKWSEVASVDVVDESIVIRRYEGGNISLKATLDATREELYRQFYSHRKRMGDPTSMQPPEDVFGDLDRGSTPPTLMTMRAHSSAVQQSLRDYRFGEAHRENIPNHRMNDTQILDRAEKQLQSVGVGNWNYLDKVAWELVQNWDSSHNGLNATRCLCVVFINASSSTVQFLEMRKRDGQGYRFLAGPQCDHDSNQLMPGGTAILFAWGHASSNMFKKGYVVMVAETTAFSGVYAVQREKVSMTSKSGFHVGFLEKSMNEWWSKQVVVIK